MKRKNNKGPKGPNGVKGSQQKRHKSAKQAGTTSRTGTLEYLPVWEKAMWRRDPHIGMMTKLERMSNEELIAFGTFHRALRNEFLHRIVPQELQQRQPHLRYIPQVRQMRQAQEETSKQHIQAMLLLAVRRTLFSLEEWYEKYLESTLIAEKLWQRDLNLLQENQTLWNTRMTQIASFFKHLQGIVVCQENHAPVLLKYTERKSRGRRTTFFFRLSQLPSAPFAFYCVPPMHYKLIMDTPTNLLSSKFPQQIAVCPATFCAKTIKLGRPSWIQCNSSRENGPLTLDFFLSCVQVWEKLIIDLLPFLIEPLIALVARYHLHDVLPKKLVLVSNGTRILNF